MKKVIARVALMACFLVMIACAAAFAGDAMDDLQGMRNTGETFDGSDGHRSGMDFDVTPTPANIPEPTPQPVATDSE